jgi:hypothetical protein
VALGAGLLFGLITMLVQYVGLFMTGFHTGLFSGVVALATAEQFRWQPATVWTSAAVILGCGLLAAVLNLYWQKGKSMGISVKKERRPHLKICERFLSTAPNAAPSDPRLINPAAPEE